MKKKKKKSYKRFIFYGFLSIMIHLGLFFLLVQKEDTLSNRKINKPQKFAIKLQKKQRKEPKKKPMDIRNKQIVDIAKPLFERLPEKAKYLSKFNTKVKKETKAKKKNIVLKRKVDKKDTKVSRLIKNKKKKPRQEKKKHSKNLQKK